MYTSGTWNGRRAVSAAVAAAIVGLSGLALDRAHESTSKDEFMEVGSLAPVDVMPGITELPEVVVRASRINTHPAKPSA